MFSWLHVLLSDRHCDLRRQLSGVQLLLSYFPVKDYREACTAAPPRHCLSPSLGCSLLLVIPLAITTGTLLFYQRRPRKESDVRCTWGKSSFVELSLGTETWKEATEAQHHFFFLCGFTFGWLCSLRLSCRTALIITFHVFLAMFIFPFWHHFCKFSVFCKFSL